MSTAAITKLLRLLQKKVTFTLEIIGPPEATAFLATMGRNRNLRPHYVRKLVGDMVGGFWTFTGEPMIFNDQGQLIDGQHRCQAIIESGVSIIVCVCRGLPGDTTLNMNTGRRRSGADVLAMKDHSHTTSKAAAVRCYKDLIEVESESLTLLSFGRRPLPNQVLVDEVERQGAFLDEVVQLVASRTAWRCPSLFAALFLRLAEIDKTRARQFFRALMLGEGGASFRIVHELAAKLSRISPHHKRTPAARAKAFVPLVYRTWIAWNNNQKGPYEEFFRRTDTTWPSLAEPKQRR